MQFETGAQPERGAESPFPVIDAEYPDLPVAKWYEYRFKGGIPGMDVTRTDRICRFASSSRLKRELSRANHTISSLRGNTTPGCFFA